MSRLFVGTYLGLVTCMLLVVNQRLPLLLSQLFFGSNRKIPTLFVGSPDNLDRLRHWLDSKKMLGIQPVGFLCDKKVSLGDSKMPFMGIVEDLASAIDRQCVVQVIALEIPKTRAEAQSIVETCQKKGCRLLIYSNLEDQIGYPMTTVIEEGHQFYTLQEEPLENPIGRTLKRTFDLAISIPVVVLLLMPLSVLVWIMQRLQAPGCLFFAQERTGFGQTPFRMLKFRSMYVAGRELGDEAQQACRGDKRVFPFGRFLRRTSLDEFPQFLNVLKGDMSVVGPRPHMVVHDQEFAAIMKGYRTRFFVRPGITGLAQCHGFRGEITDSVLLKGRVEHDLVYVTQWSIWLDMQITLKTAWQVIFPPKAAY